jgi:hypothetical protein
VRSKILQHSISKTDFPPLPGDRDYVPEHHSTKGLRKRRRTKKVPDQDLEQSDASTSTEDGDTRSPNNEPLCITKLKVAKTSQSERYAGRAQKSNTTSENSDQFTDSDRDLGDKLASNRDVKVPCPHPDCATHPTILFQSGRFSKRKNLNSSSTYAKSMSQLVERIPPPESISPNRNNYIPAILWTPKTVISGPLLLFIISIERSNLYYFRCFKLALFSQSCNLQPCATHLQSCTLRNLQS